MSTMFNASTPVVPITLQSYIWTTSSRFFNIFSGFDRRGVGYDGVNIPWLIMDLITSY